LLIRSTRIAAELLRRQSDGSWPPNPECFGADGTIRLDSIEFFSNLAAIYDGTNLSRSIRT
jgi:hypothetical protein